MQLVGRVVDDLSEADVGRGEQCAVVGEHVVDVELHCGCPVRDVVEEGVV